QVFDYVIGFKLSEHVSELIGLPLVDLKDTSFSDDSNEILKQTAQLLKSALNAKQSLYNNPDDDENSSEFSDISSDEIKRLESKKMAIGSARITNFFDKDNSNQDNESSEG
ncbi:14118_t:CDS:2, partial [Gigaspora margarita]